VDCWSLFQFSALGRIAFVRKKYADAERWYGEVVTRFAQSHSAPGAMYWKAVAHYKATNDHTVLGKVAEDLRSVYPSSVWASKAIPFEKNGKVNDVSMLPETPEGKDDKGTQLVPARYEDCRIVLDSPEQAERIPYYKRGSNYC
jgi:hypothetical protein